MNSVSGLFYAIISSATFGLITLFTVPSINSGVAVNTVVFARFFISFVAMGIVMLLKGKSFKISKNDYKTLCWLSFFYASTSILLTLSYLYIPSGMATTIHFLYPVLVTLIMILLFKESGNRIVYTAIFLAVMGVAFLGHSDTGGSINTIGLTLALITVCTYATYIVGVRKSKVHEMDSFKMTFYILMNCAIIFFINVLVQDGGFSPIPDTETALNLVMLALISTGRVTKENNVVRAYNMMPNKSNCGNACTVNIPINNIHGMTFDAKLTAGTKLDRSRNGRYPTACCTACPHSCAATAAAEMLSP